MDTANNNTTTNGKTLESNAFFKLKNISATKLKFQKHLEGQHGSVMKHVSDQPL